MANVVLRRAFVTGAALSIVLLAAGCGTPPWEEDAAAPTPASSRSAVAPTPVPNDLSGGSTQRELEAGAVVATVDYWSSLDMGEWTADALKPLEISMTTTITPADGQKVFLQRARMVAVPGTPAGDLAPLDAQTDAATVSPGYLVLSPYSYSQTFTVGALPEEATFVTLRLENDFLVQATPTSSDYAKQTVTDVLTVALAR